MQAEAAARFILGRGSLRESGGQPPHSKGHAACHVGTFLAIVKNGGRRIAGLSVTMEEAGGPVGGIPLTIWRYAGAMPVPISQAWTDASYVLKQKTRGRNRCPFVLMLEPQFRRNLAWSACGKHQD